jgi:DsbC/DsbD-like thiol-disulfide interchange protein
MSDPDNPGDAGLVKAAVEALPRSPTADFNVQARPSDGKTLVVEVAVPENASAPEVFIAGEQEYIFGAPERVADDEKVLFSMPILQRPASKPVNGALHYTLTTSVGAVEGTLSFP